MVMVVGCLFMVMVVGCLVVGCCCTHKVPLTFQKARTFFNYGGGLFFKVFVRLFNWFYCYTSLLGVNGWSMGG